MAEPSGGEDPFGGEYEPSPIERIRNQVELYEASAGAEGNTLEDRPVVILTTIGAKSLKLRKNPVIRIVRDGTYVAVASAAGSRTNPSWYGNLIAHPLVRVQDGEMVGDFVAREVRGAEKAEWWAVAETFWPHFPEYRERAGGRDIPVVVLEPVGR
jgi:F420H(2)-dependent quinone reductase